MKLADVMRRLPLDWVPEKPPSPGYLADLRYMRAESVYEIDGTNLAEQFRPFTPKLPEPVAAPKSRGEPPRPVEALRTVAWARILKGSVWDDEDKPVVTPAVKSPKEDGPRPPLILISHFDAPLGMPLTTNWPVMFANAVGHFFNGSEPIDEAYRAFSRASALAQFPGRVEDAYEYVHDVEMATRAAQEVKPLWYRFLDVSIEVAQKQLELKTPPVFVLLFTDHHLDPGLDEALRRSFAKRSHPRFLCLLARGMR